ncbi:REP-associated tyrosine transposase [Cellvibrio sp.]
MGRSRYLITDPTAPHFLTFTVLHWIPIFTRPDTVNIVLDSFRFLQKENLKIYAWVILENHLHLIAQSDNLPRDIQRFKSFTARELLNYLQQHNVKRLLDQFSFYKKAHKTESQHQFWQEGVHPELIQNPEIMRQKVEYIHANPVKRGYVDFAEHWRYSSARNFAGNAGLLGICKNW